jgi:hypothetical protein
VLIGRDRQIRFLGVEQRRRDREVRECDLGPDQVGLLREVGSSTRASRLKDSMPFATTAISGRAQVEKLLHQPLDDQRLAAFLVPARELRSGRSAMDASPPLGASWRPALPAFWADSVAGVSLSTLGT